MQHPTSAGEIMLTRLVTLRPDEPVFPSIAKLLDLNITGAPVVRPPNRYLGVFAERCAMSFLVNAAHLADSVRMHKTRLTAADIMSRENVTLSPESDAFDAISLLLRKGVSGAPVVDTAGRYLGVFSEKTGMSLLIGAAYDQLPTCRVDAFMDANPSRVIDEDRDIIAIIETFLETHLRRLPVLHNGYLVGQVTRRDVLKAAFGFAQSVRETWDPSMQRDSNRLASELVIGDALDVRAKTITPELDLLSVAGIFLSTPYRRLPVVRDGELLGLITARDLMQAMNRVVAGAPSPARQLLYLSALDRDPAGVL